MNTNKGQPPTDAQPTEALGDQAAQAAPTTPVAATARTPAMATAPADATSGRAAASAAPDAGPVTTASSPRRPPPGIRPGPAHHRAARGSTRPGTPGPGVGHPAPRPRRYRPDPRPSGTASPGRVRPAPGRVRPAPGRVRPAPAGTARPRPGTASPRRVRPAHGGYGQPSGGYPRASYAPPGATRRRHVGHPSADPQPQRPDHRRGLRRAGPLLEHRPAADADHLRHADPGLRGGVRSWPT